MNAILPHPCKFSVKFSHCATPYDQAMYNEVQVTLMEERGGGGRDILSSVFGLVGKGSFVSLSKPLLATTAFQWFFRRWLYSRTGDYKLRVVNAISTSDLSLLNCENNFYLNTVVITTKTMFSEEKHFTQRSPYVWVQIGFALSHKTVSVLSNNIGLPFNN